MGTKTDESSGRSCTENSGGKCGISRRQGVVMAVVTYAVITALLLGRAYRNKEVSVPRSSQYLVDFPEKIVASVLSGESLEEDIRLSERVVPDDGEAMVQVVAEDTQDEDWGDRLYHSSVVFGLGYGEMISSFKIYVYPMDDHAFAALSRPGEEEARFTDDLFFQLLYKSDFITPDPEKAHMYFIPVSIRSLWNDALIGPGRVGRFLSKYVQRIRDEYPYWGRTLGADHAVVVCNEYKEDGSRNVLELRKNVIQISCSPLSGNQMFYPHKDFALPPPRGSTDTSEVRDLVGSSPRTKLIYYFGTDSGGLTERWVGDSDVLLITEDVDIESHNRNLASSKYCLILMPEDVSNIVDVLRFGCVPILVSDGRMYDLPFQDILNWNQFTVIVSSRRLDKLKTFLQDIPKEQYRRKQILAMDASKHLEWHDPPKDQDAFYVSLYDLWLRRHAIRYIQREDL